MKILIASGIYPPDIGSAAQYARNLYNVWKKSGYDVKVAAYRWERLAPPIIRHFLFLIKILRKGWNADLIIVLDTWSAAVPTMVACALMRKKYILRMGGDYLWEAYVERTGDLVLFKDFYISKLGQLSGKEKFVYKWSGKALRKAEKIIYSTPWQKEIFEVAYELDSNKSTVIENFCGERLPYEDKPAGNPKVFIGGARSLKWKNVELLKSAFEKAETEVKTLGLPAIELDRGKAVYDSFLDKIKRAHAVILVSLGDASPAIIFDAIQAGTPFIVTSENGIMNRIKDIAITVNPLDENDIIQKIVWLCDPKNYDSQLNKVRAFKFSHSWKDIANEILAAAKKS